MNRITKDQILPDLEFNRDKIIVNWDKFRIPYVSQQSIRQREFDKIAGEVLKTAKEIEAIMLLQKLNKSMEMYSDRYKKASKIISDGFIDSLNYPTISNLIDKGQSILTKEQKESLINTGKI